MGILDALVRAVGGDDAALKVLEGAMRRLSPVAGREENVRAVRAGQRDALVAVLEELLARGAISRTACDEGRRKVDTAFPSRRPGG